MIDWNISYVVKRKEEMQGMDNVKQISEKAKGYFDQGYN